MGAGGEVSLTGVTVYSDPYAGRTDAFDGDACLDVVCGGGVCDGLIVDDFELDADIGLRTISSTINEDKRAHGVHANREITRIAQ